jgi:hypothetical protein
MLGSGERFDGESTAESIPRIEKLNGHQIHPDPSLYDLHGNPGIACLLISCSFYRRFQSENFYVYEVSIVLS